MKTVLILLLGITLASCGKASKSPELVYPDGATILTVKGMQCGKCKAKVTRALSKVEGVEWAQIEPTLGEVAYVGSARIAEVTLAIEGAGYEVQR